MSNELEKQLEFMWGGEVRALEDDEPNLPRHPSKKNALRTANQVQRIVVHTTDADWTIKRLAEYDITPYYIVNGKKVFNHISPEGLASITYHDVIMKDGSRHHTLPYEEISMHAGGFNTESIAVVLMYVVTDPKTKQDKFAPTKEAMTTLRCHLGELCLKFGLTPDCVVGHRELKGTGWYLDANGAKRLRKTCPGMQVNLDALRTDVASYMQIILKMKGFYTGDIDGKFGKNSRAALAQYLKG